MEKGEPMANDAAGKRSGLLSLDAWAVLLALLLAALVRFGVVQHVPW
jgi:hypothetical protein